MISSPPPLWSPLSHSRQNGNFSEGRQPSFNLDNEDNISRDLQCGVQHLCQYVSLMLWQRNKTPIVRFQCCIHFAINETTRWTLILFLSRRVIFPWVLTYSLAVCYTSGKELVTLLHCKNKIHLSAVWSEPRQIQNFIQQAKVKVKVRSWALQVRSVCLTLFT